MANAVTRFLGDSPLRVAVKLLVFSVIVGIVMQTMGWTPAGFFQGIVDFFAGLWRLGFDAIYEGAEYILLGAAVVVPIFLIVRLFSFFSRRA
ncbi:MAG: DUF6460 domain-containing protein [Pseudomonadota bacterium]